MSEKQPPDWFIRLMPIERGFLSTACSSLTQSEAGLDDAQWEATKKQLTVLLAELSGKGELSEMLANDPDAVREYLNQLIQPNSTE